MRVCITAVGNLLQNAFKFTRHGTEVTLNAYAAADRILIDVEDNCGGLPTGDTERMFLPFMQGGVDKTGRGLLIQQKKTRTLARKRMMTPRPRDHAPRRRRRGAAARGTPAGAFPGDFRPRGDASTAALPGGRRAPATAGGMAADLRTRTDPAGAATPCDLRARTPESDGESLTEPVRRRLGGADCCRGWRSTRRPFLLPDDPGAGSAAAAMARGRQRMSSLPICCTAAQSRALHARTSSASRSSRASLKTRTLTSSCAESATSISCSTDGVKPC